MPNILQRVKSLFSKSKITGDTSVSTNRPSSSGRQSPVKNVSWSEQHDVQEFDPNSSPISNHPSETRIGTSFQEVDTPAEQPPSAGENDVSADQAESEPAKNSSPTSQPSFSEHDSLVGTGPSRTSFLTVETAPSSSYTPNPTATSASSFDPSLLLQSMKAEAQKQQESGGFHTPVIAPTDDTNGLILDLPAHTTPYSDDDDKENLLSGLPDSLGLKDTPN